MHFRSLQDYLRYHTAEPVEPALYVEEPEKYVEPASELEPEKEPEPEPEKEPERPRTRRGRKA